MFCILSGLDCKIQLENIIVSLEAALFSLFFFVYFFHLIMGGELSKRQGCFLTGNCSVYSLVMDFGCSYHGFTLITQLSHRILLDLSITKYFMKFFFNFERVLLAKRGCSRTLKTHNSPPLHLMLIGSPFCVTD